MRKIHTTVFYITARIETMRFDGTVLFENLELFIPKYLDLPAWPQWCRKAPC